MRLTLIILFLVVLCGLLYWADRQYDKHVRAVKREQAIARFRGLAPVTVDNCEVVTERRSA